MLPRTRTTLCAVAVAMLMFVTIPARAEIVEFTYTGVVTGRTSGVAGTFSSGQPVMIAISIDRQVQGSQPIGTCGMDYHNVITGLTFTIGSYSRPPGPGGISGTIVGNDCSSPPIPNSPSPVGAEAVADYFNVIIADADSPNIGNFVATDLRVNLVDNDAQAFPDVQLPRVMPELSTFETATWSLSFYDAGLNSNGRVVGTLASVVTPAGGSTWGRIKTAYR